MRVYKLNSIFLATHKGNQETAATLPAHQSIKARRLPQGKICIGSRRRDDVPNNLRSSKNWTWSFLWQCPLMI